MHGTKEIIQEATSLPVEERAIVVDSLLRSLNVTNTKIDRQWVAVAKRRLAELRSGHVRAVPGDEVFSRIKETLDIRFAPSIRKPRQNSSRQSDITKAANMVSTMILQ